MMQRTALLFLLACLPVAARAQAAPLPELNNYAWGLHIEVGEPASLYRIELPLVVNQSASDAELRDVGVYNASGQAVPRLLEAARETVAQRESAYSLPFAALYRDLDAEPERIRLLFERMGGDLHIDVNSEGNAAAGKIRAPLSGYIVDARSPEQPLDALEFTWPAQTPGFVGRMNIEASDDLESWLAVGAGALADLREKDVAIEQHRIGIAATTHNFLRLQWSGFPEDWRLEGVTGIGIAAMPQVTRHTLTLEAVARDDAGGGLEFDAGGSIRVDRLDLELPQANSVITADFYYWQAAVDRWTHVQQRAFHNIRRGNNSVTSSALEIPPLRAARWKVVIVSGRPDTPLRLRLGWRPDVLLFVAQGSGPYTLGVGRAAAAAEQFPQQRVFGGTAIGELADAEPLAAARLGARFPLGGIERELPAEPLPWRTIVLWAGLVAAVMFVAWMAMRLLRDA